MKRLDKVIALNCNVSRRDARQLIKDGEVSVNGKQVLRAEELIDTEKDELCVKGETFTNREHIYLMLNKPAGVISATNDVSKKTVVDLVPQGIARRSLFPVGRLDKDTTGLLILTDDGAFAHRIMSPSSEIEKTYIAVLEFPLSEADIAALEGGITLGDGTECLPAKVIYFTDDGKNAAEISISEGKYHQVKRMFAAVGNNVLELERISVGKLCLDRTLGRGECRELTEDELDKIFE